MSDAPQGPTREDFVELANEYNRINRRLKKKTEQLEALLGPNAPGGEFPVDFAGMLNQRYSIEFSFEPGELVPQERSVTVAPGMIFRCLAMESFVRAVGTAEDPYSGDPVTVQATMPWNARLVYFDYFWKIRDTGQDREWNERAQPAIFGGGGYWGPLWLPRNNILGGGTTIFANVDPFLSNATPGTGSFFQGGSVSQYSVQISFIGFQEPDRSAP